jgi:tetratricopeptide (TPR) repeat protein
MTSHHKTKKIFVFVWTVFFLFAVSTAWSQDMKRQLRLGQELEKSGRWEDARRFYELLYQQNPDDIVIFNRLKDVCIITQAYERALEIVEARLQKRRDLNLEITRAQIHYKMGEQDEAMTEWDAILNQHPANPAIYQMVATAMSVERLLDDAVDIYLLGRERMQQDNLFALDLANLYGARMNYEKATEELLRHYRSHPNQVSIVESYLLRYPRTNRIIGIVEKQLKDAITSTPDDIGLHRLLSRFYLRAELFEESLEATRDMERLAKEKNRGESLFRFAQAAFQSGAPEIASKAYQEILERYANFPLRNRSLFGLAECREAREQFFDAIGIYQQVADEYPRSALARQSLYRKGVIQRDELFTLPEAIETFRNLIDRFPGSPQGAEGRLALGSCFIARGDLRQAETIFRVAVDKNQKKKNRAWLRALVRLADVLYLQVRFDEAQSLLEQLSSSLTDTKIIQDPLFNDGLKLRLFLKESIRNSKEPLKVLVRGEIYSRQRKYDNSITVWDSLLTIWPQNPIAAEALFKKGETQILVERYKQSLASFDSLLARFPGHLLADQALERIGWVYEKMGDHRKALERYEYFLTTYPQSFQIDEIRRRIRRIDKEKG